MLMGTASCRRRTFLPTQDFPPACADMLACYERAAVLAEWSARGAVRLGSLEYLKTAMWNEAVADHIEEYLRIMMRVEAACGSERTRRAESD